MVAKFDLAVSSRERERSCSSLDFIDRFVMGFRLLLLKVMADGAIANMSESGFKVDPSFVHSLKLPKTNSMAAKTAREKRRKIIADKKIKRCVAYEANSNGVSPIKDPMVTQIAREKRRQIIAAKKAMRCTTSNVVHYNNVQSSQQTKSKGGRNSRLKGEKLHTREAPGQKPQADNPPTNGKKK